MYQELGQEAVYQELGQEPVYQRPESTGNHLLPDNVAAGQQNVCDIAPSNDNCESSNIFGAFQVISKNNDCLFLSSLSIVFYVKTKFAC